MTYKFAVAAVVMGSFSIVETGPQFLLTGVGGVAIGVAVGWVVAEVRRRVDDPLTEITISLLTAYAAYLPAEELGVSGVLAAVRACVWLGWQASELTNHTTRLEIAFAALERIEELEGEDWVHPRTVERTRNLFDYRRRRFSSRIGDRRSEDGDDEDFDYEGRADSYRQFMSHVLGAQRDTLRRLRDEGEVTDEVRRRVEYDLDLEEARLST